MARQETIRYAFNRGLISPLGVARIDLKRSALAAEEQTNWIPRVLGPMMLRPGKQYLGSTNSNLAPRGIPFVRSLSAMYILEFTNLALRVWDNATDTLITRPSVSSAVSNGDFTTDLTGWTDSDEAGGTSAWQTGGYMGLTGNGTAAAVRDQTVSVALGDQGTEHALRIVVARGPVTLRVGSTSGGDEYITETALLTGTHSLAFTPTGNFTIRFLSRLKRIALVDSCNVEAAGAMSLPSPYLAADLNNIRADLDSLSVDVLFVACAGYQQRRMERRQSGRSWSITLYQPEDGPFRSANAGPQTLTPSVLSGNGTLTSSVPFFRSTHVGALFQATSTGQAVTASITAQNTFTSAVRITGTGTDRAVTIEITGLSGTASTVTLQRSLDSDTGPWTDVSSKTWTADTVESFNDALDNQIVWYRIGVKTGDYAAGTIVPTITTPIGSITGIARVTSYTSTTVVDIEVLTEFGGTTATDDWAEGRWSDFRGWPTAGTLYEGRMAWGGFDQIVLSISDQFDGFDPETEGDSAPIDRSIGSGPLETINWLLSLQRLILGAQVAEHSVRSNAFDEPLTPTNFNRKQCSTYGSAAVQAVKVDSQGFFVERGGTQLMELSFNTAESFDYGAESACELVPEIGEPSIARLAVQRKPDTRIHVQRSDGTVALLVWNKKHEVACWIELDNVSYTTANVVRKTGTVEDIVVLPGRAGSKEDQIYYAVRRTVNGASVCFWEKWALESECQGSTLNKQADAFAVATGGSAILTGLGHLEGEEVVCWANGKDLGRHTVASGSITVSEAVSASGAVVGLSYAARFKTAKLGRTIGKHQTIDHIAPLLRNTHAQGLEMGPDFDTMDNLPLMYQGAPVDSTSTYSEYDEASQEFPGTWDVDARLCLRATAPKPCTVLAAAIHGQVNG